MLASKQVAITADRENILFDACEELAQNLMQLDPGLFHSFFQYGEARFLYEEINKILDKHFRRGSVTFACTGDSLVTWNEPPVIAVDLEFVSHSIFAFFRVILNGKEPIVELNHITFQESTGDPEANTEFLRQAIAKARL